MQIKFSQNIKTFLFKFIKETLLIWFLVLFSSLNKVKAKKYITEEAVHETMEEEKYYWGRTVSFSWKCMKISQACLLYTTTKTSFPFSLRYARIFNNFHVVEHFHFQFHRVEHFQIYKLSTRHSTLEVIDWKNLSRFLAWIIYLRDKSAI